MHRSQAHLLRVGHDIDRIPYSQRSLCSYHGTDTIQSDVIPTELDGCDGSFVVSIDQHDPPNPAVPSLLAAAKPADFKVNGFCRNRDVDSFLRYSPCGGWRGSPPTYAQISSFTDTNAQCGSGQTNSFERSRFPRCTLRRGEGGPVHWQKRPIHCCRAFVPLRSLLLDDMACDLLVAPMNTLRLGPKLPG